MSVIHAPVCVTHAFTAAHELQVVSLVNTDEIRTLYTYNRWANRRLLRAAQRLPWPDFHKRPPEQSWFRAGNSRAHHMG